MRLGQKLGQKHLALLNVFLSDRCMAKNKTGRKQKHYVDANGKPIVGLTRRPDGRWRVIGTHQTFREDNERKAIERFQSLTDAPETDRQVYVRTQKRNQMSLTWDQIWIAVAEEIRTRPQYVAEKTGIEQLAYLRDLKKPIALPTFRELEKVWVDNARCAPNQRQKVLRAWFDFTSHAGVKGLEDICPEVAIKYRDAVWNRVSVRRDGTKAPISPKQQSHLFGGIRCLLRFNVKRGIAPEAINRTIARLQCLEPSDVVDDLDPDPISVSDFNSMLDKADGQDRALLLLMLNGAFYLKEAIALQWDDIDFSKGHIITRRKKRGQCIRVCILWRETIEALNALDRHNSWIFNNYAGAPLGVSGGQLRFTKLAKLAGVKATASQLRDGAYTAAVEAKVSFDLCRLLAGHRCGIADKYVKRQPGMVAPACLAVYEHYFA